MCDTDFDVFPSLSSMTSILVSPAFAAKVVRVISYTPGMVTVKIPAKRNKCVYHLKHRKYRPETQNYRYGCHRLLMFLVKS